MSFDADTVITNAFYVANILSAELGQTPTTTQKNTAFSLLNMIMDSEQRNSFFSGFITTYTFYSTLNNVWIGNNISSYPADVTWIDSDYLNRIITAYVQINNGYIYLTIRSMTDFSRNYLVTSYGVPYNLYYDVSLDSTNIPYTNIIINPISNDSYPITIRGFKASSQYAATTDNILPTFTQYLIYELASLLANSWEKEWGNQKEAKRKQLLIQLRSNVPVDLTIPNNTSTLKNRGIYITSTQPN